MKLKKPSSRFTMSDPANIKTPRRANISGSSKSRQKPGMHFDGKEGVGIAHLDFAKRSTEIAAIIESFISGSK
jgi:hypothetical protein